MGQVPQHGTSRGEKTKKSKVSLNVFTFNPTRESHPLSFQCDVTQFLEKLYLSSACVELVRKSNNIVSLYAKMCFLGGMEDTLTTEKIDIMWTSTLWQEAEFQVRCHEGDALDVELAVHGSRWDALDVTCRKRMVPP